MLIINYFSHTKRSNIKLIIFFLIFIFISIFNNAQAKNIGEYCVSKLTPEQAQFEKANSDYDELIQRDILKERPSRTATFIKNETQFVVETNGLSLRLRKEGDEKVIQEVTNFVKKDDAIRYLFITQDNWLFINSAYNNYMVDLNTPRPTLGDGEPTKIPAFYGGKCGKLKSWWNGGGCVVSSLYHSKSLGRAIISGYYSTNSGQKWTTVEILGGEIKTVLSPKKIFTVKADIPQYNGAILRGLSNEALFYDGKKVTELNLHIPKKRFSNTYPSWTVRVINKYEKKSKGKIGQRIYLTNILLGDETPRFVTEIKKKAEPYTTKIPFSKEIEHEHLYQAFLSFPGDFRNWGTTKNSILFELEGKYKTVLLISKSFYIPSSLRTIPHIREIMKGNKNSIGEPGIVFDVINKKTEAFQTYYIKKMLSSDNCDVMLDPDNPVELTAN